MAEGVNDLLRDKTRPPGIAPLATSLVDKVVALTPERPDHEATHWTVRAMAKAGRYRGVLGGEDLARPWPGAAPLAQLQALQRQGIRREAARCGSPLRLAACPGHRAVSGREEPDPGARSHGYNEEVLQNGFIQHHVKMCLLP
ncbi:hypothetical protein J2Y58_003692 [Sphingomonas sp. BE138]|nr:hypothetical protein [Sphingomonas sp. BE138]